MTISIVLLKVGKRRVSQKNMVSRQNSTKETFHRAGQESTDVGKNLPIRDDSPAQLNLKYQKCLPVLYSPIRVCLKLM